MPNIELKRVDSSSLDFQSLIEQLDKELAVYDGEDHAFYDQFNKIDQIKHAIIVFIDGVPVACGAFKPFDNKSVEIKRMFTITRMRGKGFAKQVLSELESWAKSIGYQACVLETGLRQSEALRLYENQGYYKIPNYGQYTHVANSVCFQKLL